MKQKKLLSVMSALVLITVLISACTSAAGTQAPQSTSAPGVVQPTNAPANTEAPSAGSGGAVTLEFQQWWEPELPSGSFRQLMDQFESENPNIKVKLLSGPYANTKQQEVAGAATGTMACVLGLDGAWVSDFVKQSAITNLSDIMKSTSYDESQLASQIKINGSTYMIPVVNFVYPLFYNEDILTKAGITAPPDNRTQFADDAKKLTSGNLYGWVLPLSLDAPNGIQNDVMAWVWASGGSMLKDGKPNLVDNPEVKSAVEYIKSLYDAKVITPGAFTLAEPDKVTEFTNGRVAMMIDSLAHINLIHKDAPDLKFGIAALPATDGYTGKRGMPYASWGIGIAESCKNKPEAWKLVSYLMSEPVNSKLATLANAFPGNTKSTPDFSKSDPLFKTAFDIYKAGYPANEFVGLPVAEDLMRSFEEQFQKYLNGDQSVDDMLKNAQDAWIKSFQ